MACQFTSAAKTYRASQNQDVTRLELNRPIQRELHGSESHLYELTLTADQYVRMEIRQRGLNVAVKLLGPAGEEVADQNNEKTKLGSELLQFIADTAGVYKLQIEVAEKDAAAGSYEAELVERRSPTATERSLEEARRLSKQSQDLRRKGKYDDAFAPAQRALEIRERVLGPDDRAVADSLHSIAVLYDDKGDYVKAEPINLRVLAIREKILGADHPDVASTLFNLAWIYQSRQDYSKAEDLYQRTLAIREKAFGPNHPEVATTLNDFAIVYERKGEYEKAVAIDERVLSIREKTLGPDDAGVAKSLNNLGLDCYWLGDYERAESLLLRAVTVWEKALGPDHPEVTTALNNLALVYLNRGDYERAEPIQKRVLSITEKALGPNHLRVGHALNNLALTYLAMGEYEQAEPLFRRALAVREKLSGPGNSEYGEGLNNLARILLLKNQDDPQAETLLLQSLPILEKALGAAHPKVAGPLNNLGAVYEHKKDYAKAENMYQRALAIQEKALGPNHPDVAATLNRLAHFYAVTGDSGRALEFLSRANSVREYNISRTLSLGSERQKLGYLKLFTKDTDTALSFHAQLLPTNQTALELAFTTLLQRKGRALDEMTDSFARLRSRAGKEDQALFNRLSNARTQLASFILHTPEKDIDRYRPKLKTLEEETDKLEAEVSARSAEFRSRSLPISLQSVQNELPARAALIEFALYTPQVGNDLAPRYAAYALSRDQRPKWVDLGAAQPIDQAITSWRQALRDPNRRDVMHLARVVDEKLMRPVRSIIGSAEHVLVSTDGPLNLIPFAALVDEHNHFLIDQYEISYLTSGRDLLRLKVTGESNGPPLIVANPAFGEPALIATNRGNGGIKSSVGPSAQARVDYSQLFFGPLPGVGEEVRKLKELLPQATFLIQDQATKESLERASGPSILHIATHGFFLESDQVKSQTPGSKDTTRAGKGIVNVENALLRSGLALAGANQGTGGILTAFEAIGLDLWGTKLVVLSACDTGVGEVRNGDGVYGLRRALVLAGAESQVMSLWPVSDRSTRDLMSGYYKGLIAGEGRGQALRKVQLQLLHAGVHNHPYYWASFIQTGEWANLQGKR